jgi:outer membrane protein/protease secretion system outer membrane protein
VGVQLNVPLYSGGSVNSVTRQVSAEIERLDEALEALRADLGVRVHREYRTVTEGVLRIEALETAVRSAEVALDSARKSAVAGVRTQVDILNAEQALSQAQRDLSESRYVMLAALVRLQSLAGESDETLIARLNALLAL